MHSLLTYSSKTTDAPSITPPSARTLRTCHSWRAATRSCPSWPTPKSGSGTESSTTPTSTRAFPPILTASRRPWNRLDFSKKYQIAVLICGIPQTKYIISFGKFRKLTLLVWFPILFPPKQWSKKVIQVFKIVRIKQSFIVHKESDVQWKPFQCKELKLLYEIRIL